MAAFFSGLLIGLILGILVATWALAPTDGGFE
jgi:hypothetical protein